MATEEEIRIAVGLRDELSPQLQRVQQQMRSAFDARYMQAQAAAMRNAMLQVASVVGAVTTAFTAMRSAVQGVQGVVQTAIDFESAFAGVRKTVDATEQQFASLRQELRNLALEKPVDVTELARIGELGGQLGIAREAIVDFTSTIADMAVTTNLSAEQAATSMARFANIMGTPQEAFSRVGSAIVELGNSFATTESEIMDMALRLAGAGRTIGLTEAEVLAFASSLSSVGIQAEAGGTAFSAFMVEVAKAVTTGNKNLQGFAAVAGMTAAEFQQAFQQDAAGALIAFIQGLQNVIESGGDVFSLLEALGLDAARLGDTMRRAALSADQMTEAQERAAQAFGANNALQREAAQRYQTTAAQLQLLKNHINDAAISLGDAFLPAINAVVRSVLPTLQNLSEQIKQATSTTEFQQWAGSIAGAIAGVARGLGSLVGAFSTSFTAILRIVVTIGSAIARAFALISPFTRHSPSLVEQAEEGGRRVAEGLAFMRTALPALRETGEGIIDLADTAGELQGAMDAAGDAAAEAVDPLTRFGRTAAEVESAIKAQEQSIKDQERAIREAERALRPYEQALREVETALRNAERAASDARSAINRLVDTPLVGTKAFDDQIAAAEDRVRELELERARIEEAGGKPSEELQNAIRMARAAEQRVRLEKEQAQAAARRQIEEEARAQLGENVELTEQEILDRIREQGAIYQEQLSEIERLTNEQQAYAQAVEDGRTAIQAMRDDLEDARDVLQDMKEVYDALKGDGGGGGGGAGGGGGIGSLVDGLIAGLEQEVQNAISRMGGSAGEPSGFLSGGAEDPGGPLSAFEIQVAQMQGEVQAQVERFGEWASKFADSIEQFSTSLDSLSERIVDLATRIGEALYGREGGSAGIAGGIAQGQELPVVEEMQTESILLRHRAAQLREQATGREGMGLDLGEVVSGAGQWFVNRLTRGQIEETGGDFWAALGRRIAIDEAEIERDVARRDLQAARAQWALNGPPDPEFWRTRGGRPEDQRERLTFESIGEFFRNLFGPRQGPAPEAAAMPGGPGLGVDLMEPVFEALGDPDLTEPGTEAADSFLTAFRNAMASTPTGELFLAVIEAAQNLPETLGTLLAGVGPAVSTAFQSAGEAINTFTTNAQTWVNDRIGEVGRTIDTVSSNARQWIIDRFNEAKGWFDTNLTVIQTAVDTTFNAIGTKVDEVTGNVRQWITERLDEAKRWLSENLPTFGKTFEDVFGGIETAVKNAIGEVIKALNKLIEGWNQLSFEVPEVNIPGIGTVGGSRITVPQIPTIQPLATGGIATRELLARIGEAGPEAVLPLDRLQPLLTDAVIAAARQAEERQRPVNPFAEQFATLASASVTARRRTAEPVAVSQYTFVFPDQERVTLRSLADDSAEFDRFMRKLQDWLRVRGKGL